MTTAEDRERLRELVAEQARLLGFVVMDLDDRDHRHVQLALEIYLRVLEDGRRAVRPRVAKVAAQLAAEVVERAARHGQERPELVLQNDIQDADALTYETAATRLGVSPRTVRRLVKAGDLPASRIGRARRIPAKAIEELMGS